MGHIVTGSKVYLSGTANCDSETSEEEIVDLDTFDEEEEEESEKAPTAGNI